jgi:hypothetical protein
MCSSWFRAFQTSNCQNRCWLMMWKMNGKDSSAQKSSSSKEIQNAMWSSKCNSDDSSRFWPRSCSTVLQYPLQMMINTKGSKKNDAIWWKRVKKLEQIWENLEVFGFGSEKMNCGSRISVMIKLL